MATYFVSNGGSNTSPYDTWAKAATSLQTALTAASTAGDQVIIQYNSVPAGDNELAADTAYTTANSIYLISASADNTGTAYTPTVMGTGNWIGNSTTNRYIYFDGGADDVVYVYGVTFRVSGSTADILRIGTGAGTHITLDNCYLWQGNTANSSSARIAVGTTSDYCTLVNCTLRFGAAAQCLEINGTIDFLNCTVSADGTAPTALILAPNSLRGLGRFSGCDLSHVTGTLVGNNSVAQVISFERCKFGSGVEVLAAQSSNPTRGSPEVFVFDCNSGDTHTFYGYYNAIGRAVSSSGAYLTAGAAAQGWEIITTSYCAAVNPFIGPWVDWHNTGTSSITPYFECLRNNGTATKYDDDEVYAEFSYKNTSGSAQASGLVNDGPTLAVRISGAGAAQADGAGTGSWTIGSSNNPASFKCDSGAAITPDEVGAIRGRIVCSIASVSGLYVDPQIKT